MKSPLCQSFKLQGVKVLDPRDGTYKHSSNPALILMDAAIRSGKTVSPADAERFAELADLCDANALEFNGIPKDVGEIFANIQQKPH